MYLLSFTPYRRCRIPSMHSSSRYVTILSDCLLSSRRSRTELSEGCSVLSLLIPAEISLQIKPYDFSVIKILFLISNQSRMRSKQKMAYALLCVFRHLLCGIARWNSWALEQSRWSQCNCNFKDNSRFVRSKIWSRQITQEISQLRFVPIIIKGFLRYLHELNSFDFENRTFFG